MATGVRLGTQATQEAEAVHERHSKVQDDGIRPDFFGDAEAVFGVDRRSHLIALQPQHAGKRLGHTLVVVHNEDFLGNGVRDGCRHANIVTDALALGHKPERPKRHSMAK
jgi:hypothetical protein